MKNTIIFSHGFGNRKDDRGLFTDIAQGLDNVKPVMFEYNEIDGANNTLTVKPFSEQTKILKKVVEETKTLNPDDKLSLICHSQGSIMAALLASKHIIKTILLGPPQEPNLDDITGMFKDRHGSLIDIEGVSRLARRDGSTTIVPAQYWEEFVKVKPINLYRELSKVTDLHIVVPNQDEVIKKTDLLDSENELSVIKIDGDHNFSGNSRKNLIELIKKILEI